jgi:seryl-tRNA synthetase
MLAIQFIRENLDRVKKGAKDKGFDVGVVDELMKVDGELSELRPAVEEKRAKANEGAKKISTAEGAERQKLIEEMTKLKEGIAGEEDVLRELEDVFEQLMLHVPSPVLEGVPVGNDDTENVEVRKWGEVPKFGFEVKDHVELGRELDLIDIERGVKVSGSRFYFLKNEGAMLEMAMMKYTMDKLVAKGFTPFVPPVLVQYHAMMGTGYFPGGEDQAYRVGARKLNEKGEMEFEDDDLNLVGTSEVSVASYHYDEMLSEEELPKLYAGTSTCFRREAGTYGKDTHGLYRVHQFQKVEQVVICKADAEESTKLHAMILENAEEVMQDLELPYRVVDVCTGDMGQGQVFKNDIEAWMPSRNSYGETHSCSQFYDFQARRLKLRYKDGEGKKRYCFTLNNTCIASPRVLIPLLEVYQNEDGTVTIPECLRPLMGGKGVIKSEK